MIRALALSSLLLVLGGCKADRCRGEPPAFQLDVVLPGGVDGSQVSLLAVSVDAAGLHKAMALPIAGHLAKGRTTVAVDVGARGKEGFSADVSVEARDATGRALARGQQWFTGTGDACNVFALTLGGGSDGPLDGPPLTDTSKRDLTRDTIRLDMLQMSGLVSSRRFGAKGRDEGTGVAIDGSGNVFVTGSFEGTVDFGGGPLFTAGGADVFLASYSSNGNFRWAKRLGGALSSDHAASVAVDSGGNVAITGSYTDTADFGAGPFPCTGSEDVFVASYDSTGAFRWAKHFGAAQYDTSGWGVAVDGSGNVTVTGSFSGAIDFGGGSLVGGNDIFVASYSSTGVFRWAKRFGAASLDAGQGLAADASGNVTVTGYFSDTVDFGGGPLVSAGSQDIFVASYSSSGAFRWARRFGSASGDLSRSVALDGSGNVVITGGQGGVVDFGGGPFTCEGVFIASHTAAGAFRWARCFAAITLPCFTLPNAVAVDSGGNVTVTGFFSCAMDFGGGPLTNAGGQDIFVASYTSAGGFRWAGRFGASAHDRGQGVAANGGSIAVTGFFDGTVDFGGGPLTSAGSGDIFLLQLAP